MTAAEFWSYKEETPEQKRDKLVTNILRNIHLVEEEFSVVIGYDYPYSKLSSQIEYLAWRNEEQRKELNKNK